MKNQRGPYTCIYREIWNEDRFWALSDAGRLVYFYILTTPLGNGLGCFRAGLAAMAEDLRMPQKAFVKAFAEGFDESLGEPLYFYDECHKVVFLPKYLQRNPSNNPNVLKSLGKAFVQIPDCYLKQQCYETVKAFAEGLGEGFVKAFAEAFPKGPGTYCPSPRPCPSPIPRPDSSKEESILAHTLAGFDTFYAAYPKHEDRADAEKAWKTTAGKRPPIDVLLAAIESQKAGDKWMKGFVKSPASWLRKGAWADEVTPYRPPESDWERKRRLEDEAWKIKADAWVAAGEKEEEAENGE